MKNTKQNTELLQQLRNGDRVAFYHIYERYCKRLYGFVLRYIKIEADADEIVQEVFVKIWEVRHKIDVNASFEAFLFTIAYNTTISLLRKKASENKYLEHLKSIQQIEKAPDIIDELHFNDLNNNLKKLLDELTPRQKEIFLLSREQGLNHDQIAQKLDVSVNTVKKHISNSILFLKSNMDNTLIINALFMSLFIQ